MAARREDTLFEKLLKFVGLGTEKVDVLVVGLDNSGKTTLCNYLVSGSKAGGATVPTVGYETQEFYRDNFSFQVIDMAGAVRFDMSSSNRLFSSL